MRKITLEEAEADLKRLKEIAGLTWNSKWHPAKVKYDSEPNSEYMKLRNEEHEIVYQKYKELFEGVTIIGQPDTSEAEDFLQVVVNALKMVSQNAHEKSNS